MVDAPSRSPVLFASLAAASSAVAATRSRLEKQRLLVQALAEVERDEIAAAVGWLVEEPLCGPLGVGPAHLWALSGTDAPAEATVTLAEVEAALGAARDAPRKDAPALVADLFARLTVPERRLFVGALTQTLRQGSLGGVMIPALAVLSGQDEAAVRRAAMVTGSVARAADALLGHGKDAPPPDRLALFVPVAPMLAAPAATVDQALADAPGERLLEWKVDGVRAQVHKDGDRVAIYSRQGSDISAGCAALLPALLALPVASVVLDGEVVRVDGEGKALPFQDTFSAVASGGGEGLRLYVFDCMHLGGRDLVDAPLWARRDALAAFVPPELVMPSLKVTGVEAARAFERAALDAGHEGIMVKDPASPYRAGARGAAWQKVKEHATADLVVLAVEHGSGRRQGLLSNLHLGARREDGTFCMVGKTFKGLTDALLAWQTERLRALAIEEKGHVVYVRPELVVEIRFNDVQRSPRYPGGVALRFARVVRYREDKRPEEADSLESLQARLPRAEPVRTAPKKRARKPRQDDRQLRLFEK